MVYAAPEKYHPFTTHPVHYFHYRSFFPHLSYTAPYIADALVPMDIDHTVPSFGFIVLWRIVTALPFTESEKYRMVKTLCNWFCMEWSSEYLPGNVLLY